MIVKQGAKGSNRDQNYEHGAQQGAVLDPHSEKSPARPIFILQYKLLSAILSAGCSVIRQS